jgi:hypothetical protein
MKTTVAGWPPHLSRSCMPQLCGRMQSVQALGGDGVSSAADEKISSVSAV